MLQRAALILGAFVTIVTALPFLRSKAWWVRIWDFPRFQLVVVGVLALAGALVSSGANRSLGYWLFLGLLGAAVLYQGAHVWRYSRLAPLEVEESRNHSQRRLTIAVSNVLQTNREFDRLIGVLAAADADVM